MLTQLYYCANKVPVFLQVAAVLSKHYPIKARKTQCYMHRHTLPFLTTTVVLGKLNYLQLMKDTCNTADQILMLSDALHHPAII
jgi:hypothetical protein